MKTKDKKPTKTRRPPRVREADPFVLSKTSPNYKEVLTLKRYTSDRGKILPEKYTGLTSKNQRLLAQEIKKARYMALLPYTDKHAI